MMLRSVEAFTVRERIAYERCPLCACEDASEIAVADASQHALYKPGLPAVMRWIRCDGCSHVFVDGYLSDAALELLFADAHASQTPGYDVGYARGVAAKIVEDVSRLRARLGGRWLDVGFGDGSLLTTADEFGYDVVGLDLRASSVERMRDLGFAAHRTALTDFAMEGRFDVVSMADVIEHMPFPKPALARAHDLLTDDGLLFVSMPNMDAFVWRDLDDTRKNPYWAEIEHVHNFGRKRLYALLEEMGFLPRRYAISKRYMASMEVIATKR
jgi:SAM-dependent methyltransferase